MKKLILIVAVLFTTTLWAQSPNKMSYQAVIRNSSNALVNNTQIGMEINIRQGTPTGTIVYTETLTPNTNANGLVSIEIGGTTNFNNINWANGPYFIETKTATTAPLTSYTIIATSQLLSVPYAQHAKTAETITGTITEIDPVFSNWDKDYNDLTNKPILWDSTWATIKNKPTFATVATSGQYNDLSNKPTTDGSETKLTAGNNINITGVGTTENPYVINNVNTHYVGELYGGGIVIWVDHTGQHGLILSMIDINTSQEWSNVSNTVIGSTNDWDGAYNTTAITGQNGHTSSAAKLCANYTNAYYGTGIFDDWYLPSITELGLIWNNFYIIQKKLSNDGNSSTEPLLTNVNFNYWSSTEKDNGFAYVFYFSSGYRGTAGKYNLYNVRAVRAF